MRKPQVSKVNHNNYLVTVTGNRDYRSPDVDIDIKINDRDEIVVRIPHTQRCYSIKKWISFQGYTELTAV